MQIIIIFIGNNLFTLKFLIITIINKTNVKKILAHNKNQENGHNDTQQNHHLVK